MITLYPFLEERANTTTAWLPSDTLQNYKEITRFGPNLYKLGDIEYKFNSHGFRCDEFTLDSDMPIVFLGCSFSEGTGLHQHETWAYQLLEKIRNQTGKYIPYWNLALSGSGIDTQANNLYWLTYQFNIKARFIFGLLPSIYRREFCIDGQARLWAPRKIGEYTIIDRAFSNSWFANHQTARSLMIIDSIRQINNSTVMYTHWDDNYRHDYLFKDNFPHISKFSTLIPVTDSARDDVHFGPSYHRALSDQFWTHIKHHF